MNRNHAFLIFFLVLIALVVGLVLILRGGPEDEPAVPLTAALNRFSTDFYGAVDRKSNNDNVFYSPISVSTAFSVLLLGTRGATRQQIFYGLSLNQSARSADDVPKAFQKMLRSLDKAKDGVTLSLANKLLVQKGFEIKSRFKKTAKNYFRTEVEDKDFLYKGEEVVEDVNKWISEKTGGKISKLFEKPLSKETKVAILNAVYFLGKWQLPFDPSETSNRTFYNIDGTTQVVPFMYNKGRYSYFVNHEKKFRLLELKYDQDVSMFIILPTERFGLRTVMRDLDEDEIARAMNATRQMDVVALLPKFKLEKSYDLKEVLSEMGLSEIFGENADLTGISGKANLVVSGATHKAAIEVSEEGTTAVAATGITIEGRSGSPIFDVDHPFFFFIRNTKTGVNYFVGRVNML